MSDTLSAMLHLRCATRPLMMCTLALAAGAMAPGAADAGEHRPLSLDVSQAYLTGGQPGGTGETSGIPADKAEAPSTTQDDPASAGVTPAQPKPSFGQAGAWALTFGGGYANDFDSADDFNVFAAVSTFLADDLEFIVELGGWFFERPGNTDTAGINGSMVFRWHFWHTEDYSLSVFGDVGIGLLGAFDEVPEGGTEFNFTPRAGAGVTGRLGDSNLRWLAGVRWSHISNGRIKGDEQNPARDSIMGYAGIIIPF